MMIDIDPQPGTLDGGERITETILHCGIKRDANVKIFRRARRSG